MRCARSGSSRWRSSVSNSDTSRLAELDVEQVVADFGDPGSLRAAVEGADVVLHLAAATRARSEAEYRRANVDATANLVAAMRSADPTPGRLVYVSSMAAAGPSIGLAAVTAEDEPRPITAYGRSKLAGERIAIEAQDLSPIVVRAPAVYGPRDRDLLIYFRLARRGLLPLPAGPERWVQLVHVEDLVRALAAAASGRGRDGGVYQAAEPRAYRWSEVAEMIADAVGRRAVRVKVPRSLVRAVARVAEAAAGVTGGATIVNRDKVRELLAPGWLCDTGPARRELDWEPRWSLPEGLKQTARWYRSNGYL